MSVFTSPGAATASAVESVNGETGAVVITASDLGVASNQSTLQMDSSVQPGLPVYVKADGHGDLAAADALGTAAVAGLALNAASTGASASVQTGGLYSLSDWSAAVGAVALVSGAAYWLGASPGSLTTSPPTSGALTLVGRAVSATTLDLDILPPIRL